MKKLIIVAYLLAAFLVVGTLEWNDHLNRLDTPQGVSASDWAKFKALEK